MRKLTAGIVTHRLPILVLGSGRTTLADKFACCLFGFLLDFGYTAESLASFVSEVAVCTTDFGVEFQLASVKPIDLIGSVFPWLTWRSDDDASGVPEDPEGFAVPGSPVPEEVTLSLEETIPAPGLLHIIHNTSNDLLNVMQTAEDPVKQLSEVCKFLTNQHTSECVAVACFSAGPSRRFRQLITKFRGKVYRSRWGNVAHAIRMIKEIETPLRRYWSLNKYNNLAQHGARPAQPQQDDNDNVTNIQVVDAAISSSLW